LDGFKNQSARSLLHHSLASESPGLSSREAGGSYAIDEKDAFGTQRHSGSGQFCPRKRRQKVERKQTILTKTSEVQQKLISILGLQEGASSVLG
jgi:hypothetical protein